MTARTYGQMCPMTRALDVVGDRWSLLIVRDLLDAPRRFSELRSDLIGISPTLLSERLKALAEHDVLVHEAPLYRLTDRGRALTMVIAELGRWGLPMLELQHDSEKFHDHFRKLGLRFVVRREVLPARPFVVDVCIDDERFLVKVADSSVHPRGEICEYDPTVACDGRLSASLSSLYNVRNGWEQLGDLVERGVIRFTGPDWLTAALSAAITPGESPAAISTEQGAVSPSRAGS